MDLKETIDNLNYPQHYQTHIDKVNLSKANDFVSAMVNLIINKYDEKTVKRAIELDDSTLNISTHLTHIIEVGGLKMISDNNLLVEEISEFKNMIVGVVLLMNCSLAIKLNNLNLYSMSKTNFYNIDAIMLIASRLSNHVIQGKNDARGFEYFSNIMIFNNLINE